ncbi:MAG: gliding motility-associated ABC transporter substrate-binding protein GldG [Leeuwenhoekiella sp.]
MKRKETIKFILIALLLLVVINYVGAIFHKRIDLTQDKRYTLSETSKKVVKNAEKSVIIDVFLEGKFPAAFRKLQSETRQLLEEYNATNPNIKFAFVNPVPENKSAEAVAQDFNSRGMRPEQVQLRDNGKVSEQLVFPWATAMYQGNTIKVPLLKKALGASPDELISRSTQNLEYAFTDAFFKLLNPKSKRIAVLKGNDELPDKYIADLFSTLRESYFIAPFPLDSMALKPQKTLEALQSFDLIVAAKPVKPFTDAQKYALDQYIMNGGKSLWLLDMVAMETDSLYANSGNSVAIPRDLNLNDMFFKYGARINPVLIEDLYTAPIVLASGQGSESQYSQLPWFYYPLVTSKENHPINSNLDNPVRLLYANQIDTLKNAIKKTVLLQSSELSKISGVPKPISLSEVNLEPKPEDYTAGPQNLSVLLEGSFNSAFQNRVLPLKLDNYRFRESAIKPTKMIIVADGDIIKNDLDKQGRPLELGFDKFTFKEYGNKEFLLNAVNYLLDDSGLINIRSKDIVLPALDSQKVLNERSTWQALMLGLPLLVLVLFSSIFYYLRRRKYS